MEKLESSFKNMVIALGIIALVSAFLLSFVHSLTKAPIEIARDAKQQSAIKEVLPAFDRLDNPIEVNGLNVFRAYKNNKFVGAAVESFSPNAFTGEIRVMVGFDSQGNVYNYVVLEQRETPGLGTKIVDWFKTDKNNQSIINRNPSDVTFRVRQDGGDIDGITASTISSRAFIELVVRAYNAFANNPDVPNALTGATGAVEATTGATAVDNTTGATGMDNTTGATQQDEPTSEKKEVVNIQPAIRQTTIAVPKTDSTSGATTKATDTDSLKDGNDSITVNEAKEEIDTEIKPEENETTADEETEENL